jgi:hypothetical protein
MLRFARSIALVASVAAAGTLLACGGKSSTPTTPTPPAPVAVTIAAPVPKSPVGTEQLDTLRPTLEVTNAVTTGTAGTVTYRFEASELDTFPEGSRTFFADGVAQGSGTTKVDVGPSDLIPNFPYFWRARATNGTVTSDWSKVETFKTKNTGFKSGQTVFDPLTDGTSVGIVRGGRFVIGQGWSANTLSDGIDYDIPTCSSCRVEFDVTNFGKKEGESVQKDVKWLTMGDGATFSSFAAFRDHPWKMHLEQRSDGDGTGMKLIWRNGGAGGGDPGDHTQKKDPGPNWTGSQVFHFVFDWTPGGLSISVNGNVWFTDGFARPFAPPNHRISLGCWPRAETMVQAIWRNVSISPR